MPYLAGFTNDIFISYASVDNEPDVQDVRWVSRFRGDLETALRRRLGQDLEIFFDQADLHANDELEALLKNARRSAIFLALCSPSYVGREWTLDELKAFCETAKDRGGPNCLVTIKVFRLREAVFRRNSKTSSARDFTQATRIRRAEFPLTPASQPLVYNERLQQLAHSLVLLLREIRESEGSTASPVQEEQTAAPQQNPQKIPQIVVGSEPQTTVFLAQVTDKVYDERQKVADYWRTTASRSCPAENIRKTAQNSRAPSPPTCKRPTFLCSCWAGFAH